MLSQQIIIDIVGKIIESAKCGIYYLSTNKEFLDIESTTDDKTGKIKISLILNYHVLTLKYMRKLKLDEINK